MAFDRYVAICNPLRGLHPRCSIVLPVVLARIPTFSFCLCHVLSHPFCSHPDVIRLACADISFNILYGLFVVAFNWGVDSLGVFLSYAFILHSVLGIVPQGGKLKALNTCVFHVCAVLILYVPKIGLFLVQHVAKHSSTIIHKTMASIYLVIVKLDCGLTVSRMATFNSSNTLPPTFYLTGIPGYEEFYHWISIPFCLLYLVGIMVPPVLNPIIYSVKTKQIRQGIHHLLLPPKIRSTVM
ncbi:hypothetical protein HPG69_005685 [Diceros bicornis minor]|uniref:G-protein coupled receptors family 1 profile domain-containing protein n=1 Tax=Diceros bicornis minor TaxID=77932 RepID=A0A7J7ESK0_DICBM|nr:hypothetical protein HPG69_005685 [Diceros bicornis minor]